MGLACGIVGLPNVGKSTLFNALTQAGAQAANYPFCTIDPNSGIVEVPDDRIQRIEKHIKTQKRVPAVVEFVDIAGLVRGASKGEGLGNQFLSHIRNVSVIIHVVRCFENDDIIHVDGNVDPLRDIETIDTELIFSDLEMLARRQSTLAKIARVGDKKARAEQEFLKKVEAHLESGELLLSMELNENEQELIANVNFITNKPVLYCCNVNDDELTGNALTEKVREFAEARNCGTVILSAAIEAEIAELEDPADKQEFLESLGLEHSGLQSIAQRGYSLLGLQTYFTAGEKEIRAWTIKAGTKAPQAAGVIHSDFERGFIRAQTYSLEDLEALGSEKAIKEAGKLRVEGKEYVVKDGDIMHFLFNV